MYQRYIRMSEPSDIVDQIQHLQTQETVLYDELEQAKTPAEIDQLIERIQQVSTLKDTLYHTLANDLQKNKSAIENKGNQLELDIQSTQVIEQQVQQAQNRALKNANIRGNKARLVELGTYETERYRVHKSYLQWLLMFLLALIVVIVLLRYNVIPSVMGSLLISIIIVATIIMSIYQLYDMSLRSNMNYDQYTWGFDPEQAGKDYQTVWEHDVGAFRKAKQEAETGINQGEQSAKSFIDSAESQVSQ